MALPGITLSPQAGSLPLDELADLGTRDLILLLSFQPYRRETIDASELARRKGMKIVAITDSRTSPIAMPADHVLVVPTETPQFFPSVAAAVALLETLLAFVVTQSGKKAVANIETFDRNRHDFSIWWRED
jgi:DNA-binding MurR/RpiR family transcriptional regulator